MRVIAFTFLLAYLFYRKHGFYYFDPFVLITPPSLIQELPLSMCHRSRTNKDRYERSGMFQFSLSSSQPRGTVNNFLFLLSASGSERTFVYLFPSNFHTPGKEGNYPIYQWRTFSGNKVCKALAEFRKIIPTVKLRSRSQCVGTPSIEGRRVHPQVQ